MNKFYGMVGFSKAIEDVDHPAKYVESYEERPYYGDVLQDYRKTVSGGKVIDDIDITNRISILCDTFAHKNVSRIRYVNYMGANWKVTDVDAGSYPRLILSLGGVFNE